MFAFIPYILKGASVTVVVILISLPIGFVIGLSLSMIRVYGSRALAYAASTYCTVVRGLPPVVIIFLVYFVVAGSINLPPLLAGTFSLAVVTSGYQAEIFRGAIQSVGAGQEIAARSIGMSRGQAILFIILPQALRVAIPSWSNEVAMIIKQSSLVYALGVQELLRRSHLVATSSYRPFFAYGTAAILYFLMTFAATRILGEVENKTRIPMTSEAGP
jgi:polar amino acid transport system permease protein